MSRQRTVFEPPAFRRIRLRSALRRLVASRDLFVTLAIHRVRVRYKQSRLGILWAVLQPFSLMLVFTLMFSFLRTAPGEGVPFPLFAYAALIPWTMFASGLTSASTALTAHAALLTKVYFPREILPVTYILAALVDLVIASVVLGVMMALFDVRLSATALWALPAVGVLAGVLAGLALLLSALQVRYRDVGLAMPVVTQVWLFATPVLYSLDAVRAALPPPLFAAYLLNPMAGIVETFRRALVLQRGPDFQALGMSVLFAAVVLPAAYLYFKHVETTMADVV